MAPKNVGPCMKMPYNDIMITKFLWTQIYWGPNFLGTKKVKGPNEIGDHFSYSQFWQSENSYKLCLLSRLHIHSRTRYVRNWFNFQKQVREVFRQILGRLAKSRISRRLASGKERGKRLEKKGFVIEARSLLCIHVYNIILGKYYLISFIKIDFSSKINS